MDFLSIMDGQCGPAKAGLNTAMGAYGLTGAGWSFCETEFEFLL